MKPIIGITGSENIFEANHPELIQAYTPASIVQAVSRSGGIPVVLPLQPSDSAAALLEHIDGIIFPGGVDVDPHYYQQDTHAKIGPIHFERDEWELAMLGEAISRQMPVLGICRGFQLINIGLGGDLYQDVSEVPGSTVQHEQQTRMCYATHQLTLKEDSLVASLLGKQIRVNSSHHQMIHQLADSLIAVGHSSDGLIEAFESKEQLILGVQWHPEMMLLKDDGMLPLFEWLTEQAFLFQQERQENASLGQIQKNPA